MAMHWFVRLVCILFVLSLVPARAVAQGPPPPPPPPPPAPVGRDAAGIGTNKTGTGRLSGRVTALDSGRPIRRAVVRVSGTDLREGKSVSTDAEGRWEIRDLPAGKFSLSASKGGYVQLQYGQRRPFESGKSIDLANGQSIEKIEIGLPRAGALTGRVVDEFGEPVTSVRVAAMRYRFQAGQRRLTPSGEIDTTDDLGQFRLYGLPPGEYYVQAQPQSAMSFLSVSGDRSGYAQTFYPNAYSPSDATRVSLAVGQEAQSLVIALVPTRFVNVSGTATSAEGQPVRAGMVRLVDPGAAFSMVAGNMGIIRPDGTWTISSVVPGEYRLVAQMMKGSLEEVAATGSVSMSESAQMTITVGNEDVTGIAIATSTGNTVRGTVKWDGGEPPTGVPSYGMVVAHESDMLPVPTPTGAIRLDGTFELRAVSGKRQFRAGGFPKGWYLKSITLNGQDITDTPIDVPPGHDISGLEVTATQRAGELSGTVQSSKGAAVTDYVVLLFPPESERWGWQSRFVYTARPDQTGRFTMAGLPEASYLAVALEYLEPGEEGNPELLEKLKSMATRVTVAEGEKKTLTLKLSAQ